MNTFSKNEFIGFGIYFFLFAIFINCSIQELPIIPKPKISNFSNSIFFINKCSFEFSIKCNPLIKKEVVSLLDYYFEKMFTRKVNCTGLLRKNNLTEINNLIINIENNSSILIPDDFNVTQENYSLIVNSTNITINSLSYAGFIRGLETWSQLVLPDTNNVNIYKIENCPIYIEDYPTFKVRGLMIDVSRHYVPTEIIYKILNGMMLSKLNILHIHFSDDDSYTLESIAFPDLIQFTSINNVSYYSIKTIREIIYFAQTRAIHIIPEFDNPAHLNAIGNYPYFRDTLTCLDNYPVAPYPGGLNLTIFGGPPQAVLDPTLLLSYNIVDSLVKDLLTVFNSSKYIHLGGDEVRYDCWESRPSIKEYMKEHRIDSYHDLLSLYISNVRNNLSKLNISKKAIYWVMDPLKYMNFQESDILQFWGKSSWITFFLDLYPHNSFILSTSDFHYLDCGNGGIYGGGQFWCDPYKSWLMIYSFNLNKYIKKHNHILGVIMPAWSELINFDSLEQRIFPRGTALGEALWSNITEISDLTSITVRIIRQTKRMNVWGIKANAIGKQWCEEKPEICYKKLN